VLEGSPALVAGVRLGDRLIAINNIPVAGKSNIDNNNDSTWTVENDKPLFLQIFRPENGLITYQINRSEFVVPCIESAYMLDKQTAYIKISLFNANTYNEFFSQAKQFSSAGMRDLVLDLRGNPGGYLEEANKILNEFFKEKGKLLCYTAGRSEQKFEYFTNGRPAFDIKRVVVIIDEQSASASEILAGAVQDWDRGAIIGMPSYGKGMVQNQFDLDQGGSLRISTARYFLPTGRCVQKPYSQFERERLGYLADTVFYRTPGGRKVKGGQGIQPDFVVKLNGLQKEDNHDLIVDATEEFVYLHYTQLKKGLPESFKLFRSNYTISKEVFERFVNYILATDRNLLSTADILPYKSDIQVLLKAHLAKFYYNSEAFYITLHENDRFVQKAYEVIKTNNPLNLR
jgi:carboxyl-terminal processing protease